MGGWNKTAFSLEIIARFGTEPDYKLAAEIGVNKTQIARARARHGIKSYAEQTGNSGKIKIGEPHRRWTSAPGNAPMRYDFRASPVRFINVDRDQPAIGERILSELSLRPLSTMSLSSVLGEKEAIVGQALSVLRYEGKVYQPSPDIGVGRHVAWAVKPCCDGEIGADSKASGEVSKASPALGITQPREQAA